MCFIGLISRTTASLASMGVELQSECRVLPIAELAAGTRAQK